jgi:hypothetical protein
MINSTNPDSKKVIDDAMVVVQALVKKAFMPRA